MPRHRRDAARSGPGWWAHPDAPRGRCGGSGGTRSALRLLHATIVGNWREPFGESEFGSRPANVLAKGISTMVVQSDEEKHDFGRINENIRKHDECSKTIQRSVLFLIIYSLFCIITLTTPDYISVIGDEVIKLPIINLDVNSKSFLLFGPLLLIFIYAYINIFINYQSTINDTPEYEKLPTIFNMPKILPNIFKCLILYALVPSVLILFAWKAYPRPEGWALVLLAAAGCTGSLLLLFMRYPHYRFFRRIILAGSFVPPVFAFLFVAGYVELRTINLARAPLSNTDFRNFQFDGANLTDVDMRNANLSGATLRGATLRRAKLSNAKLRGSDLSDAILIGADLSDADLSSIPLLDRVREGVITQRVENLLPYMKHPVTGEELSTLSTINASAMTFLNRADLTFANLTNSNLSQANLSEARLGGADLSGANLRNVFAVDAKLGNLRPAGEVVGYMSEDIAEDLGLPQEIKSTTPTCDDIVTNLRNADLTGALFIRSKFNCTNFENSTLIFTHFNFSEFFQPVLDGADLNFGNLQGVSGLLCEDLKKAKNWRNTVRDENLRCGGDILSWQEWTCGYLVMFDQKSDAVDYICGSK